MMYRKAILLSAILIAGLTYMPDSRSATPVLDGVTAAFDLQNRRADIIKLADFRGKHVLVAFGFTHCAHICPMIAANMAGALRQTDKDALGIFISVDSERDSPAITDDYARGFGDRMMGLSGSYEQLSRAAKNFSVTFVVTKSEDSYTVQHTPGIFLVGPDGNIIEVYAMSASPSDIASAMQ